MSDRSIHHLIGSMEGVVFGLERGAYTDERWAYVSKLGDEILAAHGREMARLAEYNNGRERIWEERLTDADEEIRRLRDLVIELGGHHLICNDTPWRIRSIRNNRNNNKE
jgi:hypothetical protein